MNSTARLAAIKKKMGESKPLVVAVSGMNDADKDLFTCREFGGNHFTREQVEAEAKRRGVELFVIQIVRASDHIAAQSAKESQNE